MESILGEGIEPHFVQPPLSMNEPDDFEFTTSKKPRRPTPRRPRPGQNLEISTPNEDTSPGLGERTQQRTTVTVDTAYSAAPSPRVDTPTKGSLSEGTRGHARDPLEEEQAYLFIGPSRLTSCFDGDDAPNTSQDEADLAIDDGGAMIVSESPGAIDIDIYEKAYQEEIERIQNRSRALKAPAPTIYLTRRVGNSSGLSALIRQATQDRSLSMGGVASTKGAPSLLNVANKLASTNAASETMASSTTVTESMEILGEASTSAAADLADTPVEPLPTELSPMATAPSKPTASVTTTTTTATTATASIPQSPPERSRSGLRNLLGKVRPAR